MVIINLIRQEMLVVSELEGVFGPFFIMPFFVLKHHSVVVCTYSVVLECFAICHNWDVRFCDLEFLWTLLTKLFQSLSIIL